ncbi:S-adenosyl-L-methionine-dependent methyltransferase [Penicillium atrosanguineum]|uniref:S-adenosyl-L-methionine-dependent methyltransferase n=1 Tax=Penicillium atrosanguineum TaxID=1132637 RepID=UPI00239A4CEF|nr:S-adenosyl-L-methionine-dependent methyltransferase [Penicillium atrosanguineum]KAJ5309683.1 S-adenosyl-L-methionine-dependent methyltransferase [Penicillium atrosanguineum]
MSSPQQPQRTRSLNMRNLTGIKWNTRGIFRVLKSIYFRSNVPRDQQSQHVHKIRDQAWAIRSYPCTGLGVWLVPFISRSPAYPIILQRLRSGATFMDIGCFLGGDMRRLVFDGAPSANLDRFDAHFILADIMSPEENPELQALKGSKDQLEAAKKLVAFAKPGALVMGYQIGNVEAKEVVNSTLQVCQWRHDPVSFAKMWDQVGAGTDSKWEAQAWLRSWDDMGWDPADQAWLEPGDTVIDFVVSRTH